MTDDQGSYPRFEHDCKACHFLGQHGPHDLYFCDDFTPTVIARNSSEPGDYSSGLAFGYGSIAELTEARRRAVTKGLLQYELNSALFHTPEDAPADVLAELKQALQASELGRAFALFSQDAEQGRVAFYAVFRSRLVELQERYPKKLDDELLDVVAYNVIQAMAWAHRLGLPCPGEQVLLSVMRPG